MKYKQCHLENEGSQIIVWLDAEKVKPNIKVKLKNSDNPNAWWTIVSVSENELEQKDIDKNYNGTSFLDRRIR